MGPTLINSTSEYVKLLLSEKLDKRFYYHDLQHTLSTVEATKEIAEAENVNKELHTQLIIGAWFHDTGYSQSLDEHEKKSCEIATSFLIKEQVSRDTIGHVCQIIMATKYRKDPQFNTLEEAIIHDADVISIGKSDFFHRGDLLRKEWEALHNKKHSDDEWKTIQINFLTETKFLTSYCQKKYNPIRLQHLNLLKA